MRNVARVVGLISFLVAPIQGQNASPDYSQEALVMEKLVVATTFEADGTRVTDNQFRIRVTSTAGIRQAGTLIFPYKHDLGSIEIDYVRVRKPSGEVVETPVSSAIDLPADITRAAPTYSDLYAKHVNVQGLTVGDVLEYRARARERSVLPGNVWIDVPWSNEGIVLDAEFRLSVPSTLTPTVRSRGVQPTVSVANGQRTYVWHRANLKHPTEDEQAIQAYAERDLRPVVQVTSFRSWAELGEAVRLLWKDRATVTPAIREKALELTRNARTEQEKIDALYKYVALQIRYVAIAFGVGSIQPHAADDVLKTGFGDCKDKHTLLTALLKSIGIDADAALIGVGEPLDREVPSPSAFNHVITRLRQGQTVTWLDTTLEVAPPGFLGDGERDHDVLILPSSGAPTLERTPATSVRENSRRVVTDGSLDRNGKLDVKVTDTLSGDLELLVRAGFRVVPQAQWIEVVKQISIASSFGGNVSDLVISPLEDTSTPLRIEYRYVNESVNTWAKRQLIAPLPSLDVPQIAETPAPVVPVDLGGIVQVVESAHIRLPETFTATLGDGSEPETRFENGFASFRYTTSIAGGAYDTTRELRVKAKEVPLSAFAEYRMFQKAVDAVPGYINLRELKPWAFGDSAEIDWYGAATAGSLKTLQSASAAGRASDYRTAIALLDDVTRAEPKNASAWLLLGWAQVRSGARDTGLDTLRRQAETTPTPALYKELAIQLASSEKGDEAARVWAKGRELYPDDRDFSLFLGERLLALGRFSEALPIFKEQSVREAASGRVQWNLGKASLGVNQKAEALQAFKRAGELDGSAYALNEAAWALVEANLGLDVALDYATRSVRETETATAKVTLAGLDDAALRTVSQLSNRWDTLAWVYFKRGDLATAERFQKPAWELGQRAVLAEHLAEIAEARKDVTTALRFYELAGASDAAYEAPRKALARLLPPNAKIEETIAPSKTALLQGRTVTVPRLPGAEGTAEVFVRVGADGIVDDVRFVAGAAALRPEAETLRTVKLPSTTPSAGLTLIRRGVLSCAPDAATCQFRLIPANDVTSVN